MAKDKKKIEKIVKEFFKKIGLDYSFKVTEDEEAIDIVVDTDDPGLIIGRHGDTLDSVQLVLSLIIAKSLGEFKRITLEVADYKKNRSDYLRTLADETKEKVIAEQKEIFLPDLKPWERRIVHLYFKDDKEVVSESTGEGKERTLAVRPA